MTIGCILPAALSTFRSKNAGRAGPVGSGRLRTMSLLIKISALAILQVLAIRTLADAPPRLEVAVADPSAPLTFIAYGDTRFTQRDGFENAVAQSALVAKVASEKPAAIFIGGDLVNEGSNPAFYETYRS